MRTLSTRTLDYDNSTPFAGVFGKPRKLAWPVHAYRVTIPAPKLTAGDRLNPFERVILKVIDAVGALDERGLADATCIPPDLVHSAILRLRDKGFIDVDNVIINQQRTRWEQDPLEDVYTSALVFRELVGGSILPFVHILDDDNPIRTKNAEHGTRRMPRDRHHVRLDSPSSRDVIRAITEMGRRAAVHAQTARTPNIAQVRVAPDAEDYWLDCRIAIQLRDAEFRIADPFGTGFSRVLEGAFTRRLEVDEKLQSWMDNWRQNLSVDAQLGERSVPERGPFDTTENRRRYPELLRALTPHRGARHRSVEDIYASLEWALFYTCEARGPEIAIRRLKLEAGPHFSNWLASIAASIGLDVPEFGFRRVPEGKFVDYVNGRAEMGTVMAIALIQAQDDPTHPLRRIARTHPDFIVRVGNLRKDRDARAHGERVALATEELQSDPFMREVICTLLPAVSFEANARGSAGWSQADLLLDARNSLLATFGYRLFNRLGPIAQASLLDAERFWIASVDGDDARSFISNLYSALQGVLRRFVNGLGPVNVSELEYKSVAAMKAEQAGLGSLPRELVSVRSARIRDTLLGDDRSVGALTIALLLSSNDVQLKELADAQTNFLAAIAAIVGLRGHGNQPTPMRRAETKAIRAFAVTTLVTLLEMTQGD